jgi:succinyl-CoA synthetase beta subunit
VLTAVDINPLVVAPTGGGVHVLDALIVPRTT